MLFLYLFLSFFTFGEELSSISENNQELNISEMLQGPNNVGTEFWLTVPPPYLVANITNYTRFFICASADANVRIKQKSGIDMTLQVPAGTAKSFDLKPYECQPYIHNSNDNYGLPAQVHAGKALHITSDQPIIVYVMIRYQYTSDGYLALPVDALGTKYVSTVYDAREWNPGSLPNMVCIVSPYDNTSVDFILGGNDITSVRILGGKVLRPGDKHTFKMNKGDVVVLSNVESDETLSGSLIEGDKPVAVISGQYCTDIPLRVRSCDYTVEMDIPMHSWGQVYNVPYMENRDKPSILRVFARDPETTVWRDGQEFFYFTNGVGQSGGTQNNAWYETRVWPIGLELRPAVYTSDKPIYIALFNPSTEDDNKPTDPFSMLITPVDQYQNQVLFATPAASGGLNFETNFLNIIFETDETDEKSLVPEDMMFGVVKSGGNIDWTTLRKQFGASAKLMYKIGSAGDADAISNTPHRGRRFGHKWVQLPGDGIFVIKSSSLFACYSSGVGDYDSYGFPTGTSVKILNSGDTLAPKVEWTIGCDGKVIGKTSEMHENNINIGLFEPNSLPDDAINFSQLILDEEFEKGSLSINWTANVIDIKQPASLIVTFYDLAGNFIKDTIKFDPKDNSLDDPIVNIDGDLLLCNEQESVNLVLADGNYTKVEWSNGETSKTLTTNKAGEYYATIFDDIACTKTTDKYKVIVADNNLIEILEVNSNQKKCLGDTVKLKIPDTYVGGELTWSNGESTREVSIIESGDYWFTYNNEDDNCDYYSNTFTVDFKSLPEKPVIVLDNFLLKVETSESKIEWFYEGQNFNKSNLKIIAPTENGIYTCEVSNSAGCSTMSEEFEVAFVSVERISENELNITPNPNNGDFQLEINSQFSGLAKITIVDLSGQEIFSNDINLNKNRFKENINLNNAAKGVYLLKIKTEADEISSKFIVK